jgi:hypothetical protein
MSRNRTDEKPRRAGNIASLDASTPAEWLWGRPLAASTDEGTDWSALDAPINPAIARSPDGVVSEKPRCIAAYSSGIRCIRRARVFGMCFKCARRAAPIFREVARAKSS